MKLYPYNMVILYLSLVLLLGMIVYTLLKISALAKAASAYQPLAENMQRNAKLAAIKLEAYQEKKAEDRKKNRVINMLMPVVLAVYDSYRRDSEHNGVKGVFVSAKHLATNEKERNKLIAKIRKAI